MHRDGRRATGKTSQAVAATAELVLDGQPVVIVCPSRAEQIATRRLLSDRIEATRLVNQPAFTRHDALSVVWYVRHLDPASFGSRGVSSRTTVFWDLSDEDFPDWARDELSGYRRADQTAYQRLHVDSVPLTAEVLRSTARSIAEQYTYPYRSGTLR